MEYWANKGFVASTEGQLVTYTWLVLRSPTVSTAIFRWYEE